MIDDLPEGQTQHEGGIGQSASTGGLAVTPDEGTATDKDLTMNASREMPKYECHKKVWALKIAGIVGDQHGGVYFQPAEEGYNKVPMSPEYVAKHRARGRRLLRDL